MIGRNLVRQVRHISQWNASEVITDRKSRFQARTVPLESGDQVGPILAELVQQHKSIKKASHPHIIAWRTGIPEVKNGVVRYTDVNQGYQDNGEKGAGIKILEQVLIQKDVYNFLVIVTRWYGGTPLGNSRYRHIVNASLESLRNALK